MVRSRGACHVAVDCCATPSTRSRTCATRSKHSAPGVGGRAAKLSIQQLGDAVTQLASVGRWDQHADRFQPLGQAIRDWADQADIELWTADRHGRALERAGLEIGL
jgi:hypothetical protein